MTRTHIIALIACTAVVATGCGDSNDENLGAGGTAGTGGSPGAGGAGGGGEGATGGAGGDPGTPALPPLSEAPRFAVVSSNFEESSVAVLDADFDMINESWINSGTTFPGLVATLSGDVVLPTQQAGDGTLALVDRLSTDVVSRFYVPSGNLEGQTRTQEDGADYSANPHDFIFVDANSGWATRYEPNLNPDADPINRGTDLIEIDPSTATRTGIRVDLSPYDTTETVMGDGGPTDVTVHARPDRGVLVGSTLVVGLDRISARFDAAGPGAVALIDVEDLSTALVPLGEGLASCGDVSPVPGAPTKLMVACAGYAQPFLDEAQTRASSGILVLDVAEEGVTIETTWRPSDHSGSALSVQNVTPIDESHAVGVAFGDFDSDPPDALYLVDLDTGDQTLIVEALGSFAFGASAYEPGTRRLYVPDSDIDEVRGYELGEEGVSDLGSTPIAPTLGFPPVAVYLLE